MSSDVDYCAAVSYELACKSALGHFAQQGLASVAMVPLVDVVGTKWLPSTR